MSLLECSAMGSLSRGERGLLGRAVEELLRELGDRVVAVALFGSRARGEADAGSDYDFLVVVRGLRGLGRRFRIYDPLRRVLKTDVTVLDVDESKVFREDLTIDPLLLNIAWDAVVLYDPTGRLDRLFKRIRMAVKEAGLIRYRTKDGKYGWKPAKGGLKTIEV